MAVVVMHAVASMDGYIADTDDEVGPLFEWYFNGDVEIVDGGPFKVSKASADYVGVGGGRGAEITDGSAALEPCAVPAGLSILAAVPAIGLHRPAAALSEHRVRTAGVRHFHIRLNP